MLKETLNKGISTPVAIGIILILAIFVGGFAWWQYGEIRKEETNIPEVELPEKKEIKNETTDWRTYRNEKYGFEFKYPPILSECEEYCRIQESEEGFSLSRTFLGLEDSEGLTLSEFVDKAMEGVEIERKEKIFIDEKEGITVDYRFGGMGRFGSATFIKKNNTIIKMEFTAGGFCCLKSDKIIESEVYDAMRSTLHFID